ncbi:MAG: acetylglutamate kinase [Bryobacteraceae bacterium]
MRLLIKLGGTLLDVPESRDRLAAEIAVAAKHHEIVVVHGGGKQMTRFLAERGVESTFVGGLRVSTPEVIDAVVKVFAGSVNKDLVGAFIRSGAPAVGICGLDGGLLECDLWSEELGQVGRPKRANPKLLNVLVAGAFLPVVACVGGDSGGRVYNVNADQMASALAVAFEAERLLFLTDVEGVRGADGSTISELTASEAEDLIRDGVAIGGMQAKLEAARRALESVGWVHIAPGMLPDVVSGLIEGKRIGTVLVPGPKQ